jgi:predicted GNAT family N-acyltransferase
VPGLDLFRDGWPPWLLLALAAGLLGFSLQRLLGRGRLVRKRPSACSAAERDAFVALASSGHTGVAEEHLRRGVEAAERLIFYRRGGRLIGCAALKRPQRSYRERLASPGAAGIRLDEEAWPFELGYVVVRPEHRGLGLSARLVGFALEGLNRHGVFATTRTAAMGRTLTRFGFQPVGAPYPSAGTEGGADLRVWVRPPG